MARTPEEQRAYMRAYYERNAEAIKARSARRRAEKPEECRTAVAAWHADPKNREKVNTYFRDGYAKTEPYKRAQNKWRKENKPALASKKARHRAMLLQRTPGWLTDDDMWMIGQAYELAALRTKMFGFKWHVDHEVPLQGRSVCGLHVPTNLRVIPAVENIRKSNNFVVE